MFTLFIVPTLFFLIGWILDRRLKNGHSSKLIGLLVGLILVMPIIALLSTLNTTYSKQNIDIENQLAIGVYSYEKAPNSIDTKYQLAIVDNNEQTTRIGDFVADSISFQISSKNIIEVTSVAQDTSSFLRHFSMPYEPQPIKVKVYAQKEKLMPQNAFENLKRDQFIN